MWILTLSYDILTNFNFNQRHHYLLPSTVSLTMVVEEGINEDKPTLPPWQLDHDCPPSHTILHRRLPSPIQGTHQRLPIFRNDPFSRFGTKTSIYETYDNWWFFNSFSCHMIFPVNPQSSWYKTYTGSMFYPSKVLSQLERPWGAEYILYLTAWPKTWKNLESRETLSLLSILRRVFFTYVCIIFIIIETCYSNRF